MPARPELQDGHGRPAREPERRARRDAASARASTSASTTRSSTRTARRRQPALRQARLPHLNRLLAVTAEEALAGADVAVVVVDRTGPSLEALRDRPAASSSTSTAGSAPSRGTSRLRGGRLVTSARARGRSAAAACSDHRPEPARCRSTGGSGSSARRCVDAGYDVTVVCPRARSTGDRDRSSTASRIHALPAVRARRQRASASRCEYAYSLARHGAAGAQGAAARALRRRPGLQPAGHLLAAGRWFRFAGRHPVRLRPPRPVPRAVRVAVPGRAAAATRACCSSSGPRSAPPTRSSRPTSPIAAVAHAARRQGAPSDVTVVRTGPDPDALQAGERRPELCAAAAATWSPTSA